MTTIKGKAFLTKKALQILGAITFRMAIIA